MSEKYTLETEIRVRYAETDAMGIVHHANYIVWFEVGRGEYIRQIGSDLAEWKSQGLFLPVSEVYARYIASARYGDMVTVKAWVESVRSRGLTFAYEAIQGETGQILTTGWTKHVCTDRKGRVRTIPQKMRELLKGN